MKEKFITMAVNAYPYLSNDVDEHLEVELLRKAFVDGAEVGFAAKPDEPASSLKIAMKRKIREHITKKEGIPLDDLPSLLVVLNLDS